MGGVATEHWQGLDLPFAQVQAQPWAKACVSFCMLHEIVLFDMCVFCGTLAGGADCHQQLTVCLWRAFPLPFFFCSLLLNFVPVAVVPGGGEAASH